MSSGKKSDNGVRNVISMSSVFLLVLLLLGSYSTVRKMDKLRAMSDSVVDEEPVVSETVSEADLSDLFSNEPPPLTKTAQVTISFMGDVMGHNAMLTAARNPKTGEYNFDNIFPYITPFVSASDYAVANLETTLRGTEGGAKYQGYPNFNTPDEIVDAVKKAGFDMMLTANNHSYDTGIDGMKRTIEVLNQKGMDHTGTFADENEPRYLVKDINGLKVGMICYTYSTTGYEKEKKYLNNAPMTIEAGKLINTFNTGNLDEFYTELAERITAMKAEGAEQIILFVHWGTEYKLEPNQYQQVIAQKACDLGVDVIVGGHPHVIEPIELLSSGDLSHKTVCIYSLGNAVSNQRRSAKTHPNGYTEDGCLFSVTFNKYSDGRVTISDVNLLPTWVNMFANPETQRNVYRIVPLDITNTTWGITYDMKDTVEKEAQASYKRTTDIVGPALAEAQKYYRKAAQAILSDSDLV